MSTAPTVRARARARHVLRARELTSDCIIAEVRSIRMHQPGTRAHRWRRCTLPPDIETATAPEARIMPLDQAASGDVAIATSFTMRRN